MSHATLLRNGLAALFEEAEAGNTASLIQAALLRMLLAKGLIDRDDILDVLRRLEARAVEVGGEHAFFAADLRNARDELAEMVNRDPGLGISITEPTLEDDVIGGAGVRIE